jgi:hypothetical protein
MPFHFSRAGGRSNRIRLAPLKQRSRAQSGGARLDEVAPTDALVLLVPGIVSLIVSVFRHIDSPKSSTQAERRCHRHSGTDATALQWRTGL